VVVVAVVAARGTEAVLVVVEVVRAATPAGAVVVAGSPAVVSVCPSEVTDRRRGVVAASRELHGRTPADGERFPSAAR
jgi:hypothetical protein